MSTIVAVGDELRVLYGPVLGSNDKRYRVRVVHEGATVSEEDVEDLARGAAKRRAHARTLEWLTMMLPLTEIVIVELTTFRDT